MPTLPEPSPLNATRLSEQLAEAALALDTVVDASRVAADAAVNSHARTVSALADLVVSRLHDDPDYTPSDPVLRALGWAFAEGPLWIAAQRAGYLTHRQPAPGEGLTLTETDSGDSMLRRISDVVPEYNTQAGTR